MYPLPELGEVRASVAVFDAMPRPDKSLGRFHERTAGRLDLEQSEHADALLDWLNAWSCRLDKDDEGRRQFAASVGAWWDEHAHLLPEEDVVLADLSDDDIAGSAQAFDALRQAPASGRRSVAPTAAAKTLYALRPHALLAWDKAIAQRMHSARGRSAYADHLTWGRAAAQELRDQGQQRSLATEPAISASLGREDSSLAKLLDEHLYVTISRQ